MNFKEFENPAATYRPAPLWSWNDRLDRGELKRQICEMADKGWGGYFMHPRVGLVTGYLSEEWMELIRACAEEARRTGTYAWLYDEDKWPSGFAGGEVPEMKEEYRSRALVLLTEKEPGDMDTVLHRTVKNGRQYFLCRRVSPLGNRWFNGTSYVDLMNPEAVKAFIRCTHERYKEACGEYFGKEIPGIFTDEPCYLMEDHYEVPVLPWSDCLPAFFERIKGYEITQHLEELFFDEGDYRKIRFDFFDAATRLFMESFTKQYYDWCSENNLKMTGHFMAEDNLPYQTQWIGAAMPHYQFMHWPGIDKLERHIEQLVTVKQVASAADQLDKERTFSEVFGCVGQQVSFYHRKWIADWQAALGISFVNNHLSLYSMRGERKRDYPANLFYQQPWWEEEKAFADYIGRLSYAVSTGRRKVDILVLHPVSSVWCEYSPLHKQNGLMEEIHVYSEPFEKISKGLTANKLDFHYGDEIIMESHARVEGKKLVVGAHSYSTVIVPPSRTLRSNTVKLLEEFVKAAGRERLIFVRQCPDRIDGKKTETGLPCVPGDALSIKAALEALEEFYPDRISITDRMTGENAPEIIVHERDTEKGGLILFTNTNESRELKTAIRIKGGDKLAVLDLMSGAVYRAQATYGEDWAELKALFYPAGSLLLLKTDEETVSRYQDAPAFLDSGIAFGEFTGGVPAVNDWQTAVQGKNVLPLNDAALYLDGVRVLDKEPLSKAWHEHFYTAEDGTRFRAEYSFKVLRKPEADLFAAIECAENLDRITFNGHELKALKHRGEQGEMDTGKSWLDVNFTRVPLQGFVRQGENVLVLEGRKVNNITGPGCHKRVKDYQKHEPNEAEAVYIVGDFQVSDFDREAFAITVGGGKPASLDLTSSGYPFYAGSVKFSADIEVGAKGKPVLFRVNEVRAACIKLFVNGKEAGVKYWAPYVFDVTGLVEEGTNRVEVVAASTLFNLLGPNRVAGILKDTGVGHASFINHKRYTSRYELLPFGIGSGTLITD